MGGFYIEYLENLCQRRGWAVPMYEPRKINDGWKCLVTVNGRDYQTDIAYQSDRLAQENAAMRAFMVCRNFSQNGGMLARNGIVQGLPTEQPVQRQRRSSRRGPGHGYRPSGGSPRYGHHSSSSSTTSLD